MPEDSTASAEEIGRRRFLSGLIGVIAAGAAALVGVPAIAYLVSPGVKRQTTEQWVPLGPLSSLQPGVPTGFPYSVTVSDGWVQNTKSGTAYAVTPDGVSVTVFSDICTHLSCRVTWQPDNNHFFCPCHDGAFGPDGSVTAGPPPRPLDEFESRVENDQISILVEV